jgi:hypothetical protein
MVWQEALFTVRADGLSIQPGQKGSRMTTGKFITSKMAAEKLGFSPDYIRRRCADGTIKAEKLGAVWIVQLSELRKMKRQRYRRKKEIIDERSGE